MADLSKIKLNGIEYDLKDAVARMLANTQSDWEQTDETALDYIKNKPVDEEPVEYTIEYDKIFMGFPLYKLVNNTDDLNTTWNNLLNGNVKINRDLDVRVDPIDTLPTTEGTIFYLGDYKKYEVVGTAKVFYHRVLMLDSGTGQITPHRIYDDTLCAWKSGNTIYFFPYLICKSNIDIIVSVGNNTLPCSITVSDNAPWGKQNLAKVKALYAPYDTLNRVRMIIQGDNVYLNPYETVSQNALPRYYGESKRLGKKYIITFSDYADGVQPTATVELAAEDINLPLIITASCNFTSSLTSGIDTPLEVNNVSNTYADIAEAVSNNRPVKMIISNGNLRINLELTAFDGNIYYFTNSYDPFTMMNGYDNESFNITVKASQVDDSDIFTWMITYNKNVFAKKSEVQTQINEAIGGITEFDTQVVQSLPQTGVEGTIYFTPNSHGANDAYDEFIYVNNAWEKIGNTQVDLSGYAQSDDLAYVAFSGDYENLSNRPNIPTKTSDLTNDSNFITLNDVPVELPAVTSVDNNKVLTVDNGAWSAKTPATPFSGSYNDLSDKPTLFSGNYNDLTNKPTLFSGSYNDLSDKPTIPSATTVTQTVTSGIKIAEINGTAIYAPAYANGDQIAY